MKNWNSTADYAESADVCKPEIFFPARKIRVHPRYQRLQTN